MSEHGQIPHALERFGDHPTPARVLEGAGNNDLDHRS